MARIEYKNDNTRALEEAEGSDGRMNVSSRSDGRGYYNSRDEGQTYAMTFEHLAAASGEYSAYIKNESTTKTLVVSAIGLNATAETRMKLEVVSGTAAGADIVPRNLNLASAHDAVGTFKQDTGGAISGLTDVGTPIDFVLVPAGGHEELRLNDRLRLGQNDSIAIEVATTATTSDVFGVVFFYYE